MSGRDDTGPFFDVGHDAGFELIGAGRLRVVAKHSKPLDSRWLCQNLGCLAVQSIHYRRGNSSRPSKSLPRGNDISRKGRFGNSRNVWQAEKSGRTGNCEWTEITFPHEFDK